MFITYVNVTDQEYKEWNWIEHVGDDSNKRTKTVTIIFQEGGKIEFDGKVGKSTWEATKTKYIVI